MASGRPLTLRFPSLLAPWLLCAAQIACYKPSIVDGGLRCRPDAGVKSCPEGFACHLPSQTCWRNPDAAFFDAKIDGVDATDVMDGADGPDVPEGPICFDPKMSCTPGPGTCDPVCQMGCTSKDGGPPCREKCSLNTTGLLTCNQPLSTQFPRTSMQPCTIDSEGTPDQTDNCAPGLVCMVDGSCPARCFQFCNGDGDCTNASCTRDVGRAQDGGVVRKVCDVPFVDSCVPLPGMGNTGCVSLSMACYISSSSPTHTICDCPHDAMGPNAPCARSRECNAGLACVDKGDGAPICLQVCRLSLNGLDCPQGTPGSCHPYRGLPPGTTSHPTFGYCY